MSGKQNYALSHLFLREQEDERVKLLDKTTLTCQNSLSRGLSRWTLYDEVSHEISRICGQDRRERDRESFSIYVCQMTCACTLQHDSRDVFWSIDGNTHSRFEARDFLAGAGRQVQVRRIENGRSRVYLFIKDLHESRGNLTILFRALVCSYITPVSRLLKYLNGSASNFSSFLDFSSSKIKIVRFCTAQAA